jgi:hypothetical protein
MQYQDDNSNEIFTWKVKAGNRVYFMNVKKDKNERLYLVIKESKQGDEEGGAKEVHRIMIFEKDFDRFFYGMEQVAKFVNNQIIAGNLNQQSNYNQNNTQQNQDAGYQNQVNQTDGFYSQGGQTQGGYSQQQDYSSQAQNYANQTFSQIYNQEQNPEINSGQVYSDGQQNGYIPNTDINQDLNQV